MKRDCKNGKDCPFSHDTKLRDKAEKNGPPKSRSASPKGRGDKVCRDFLLGRCKRGDKCAYVHKSDKPATPAIRMAATSPNQVRAKKTVKFSDVIHTKPYVIPVKEGVRWRKPKDPYQKQSKPRLCDMSRFSTTEHIENVEAHMAAARSSADLMYDLAQESLGWPRHDLGNPL